MNLSEIVQSSGWKNFMSKLYGIGAAVVIVGALFKIQHWPGGGLMITLGLAVEAVIFFFSAFEPLHEDVDWTMVYPELAGIANMDEIEQYSSSSSGNRHRGSGSSSAMEKFDGILEKAEISPKLFEKLGEGIDKLSQTASKFSDISDAIIATNEYVDSVKAASSSLNSLTGTYNKSSEDLNESVSSLSSSYRKTAESIAQSGNELTFSYQKLSESMNTDFNLIVEGNKSFGNQLEMLNKNLSALNAVYELQLQETNEHLKDTEKLYSGVDEMMKNLKSSVEETQKYTEEVSKLSQNLSELNAIYGNMLSAMNVMSNK